MKVILMRHGQAEPFKFADDKRQLTDFGYVQAQQTAEYLLSKHMPDKFVVSPYDRAKQTLAAFTKLAPQVPMTVLDTITPSGNANIALDSLEKIEAECLLVVCHMPIVANMAGLLLGQLAKPYELAEATVIQTEVIYPELGTQIDSFIPQQY